MRTNFLVPRRDFDESVIEMMDRPQPVSAELESDLENLSKLNRFFGAYSLVSHFLRRWFQPHTTATLVDLCTGYGDIPRFAVDWCRNREIDLKVTAVDFQEATLELAARRSSAYPEISFIQCNVFNFEKPEPADFVFCSLALHHFSDMDAVALMRLARALAAQGVLIGDLERSDLGIVGIHLLTSIIYREPMTRFDGRLSFRRAFSFSEMRQLALKAGWNRFGHKRFPVSRQAIWCEGLNPRQFPASIPGS